MDMPRVGRIVSPGCLHLDIRLVANIGQEGLGKSHVTPSVVDVDTVDQVYAVVRVHDKTSEMTEAVTAKWIKGILLVTRWYADPGSCLQTLAIEKTPPAGLECRSTLNRGRKQFVSHSTMHLLRGAGLNTLLELRDTSLDEIEMALPVLLVDLGLVELDIAFGMVRRPPPGHIDAI